MKKPQGLFESSHAFLPDFNLKSSKTTKTALQGLTLQCGY